MGVENIIYLVLGFSWIYFSVLFLVLYLNSGKRIKRTPSPRNFPSVTVVVPAHNEEEHIAETVENLKRMEYPGRLEILVVDDGSTDRTCELAKKAGARVLRLEKNRGKAAALNYALRNCSSELFAVVDADTYPKRDALLKTVGFFSEPGVAAVTSSVFVKRPRTLFEKFQAVEYITVSWTRKMLEEMESIYVTPGTLSVYRRDVILKLGGFDETNLTEDIEIAWRLINEGYKIRMSLTSEVSTAVPKTLSGWWKQRLRWNIGGMQTFFKYASLLLKGRAKGVSLFLLPFFSVSYLLSLIGFLLMFYLLWSSSASVLSFFLSLGLGVRPEPSFELLPTTLLILGFAVLGLSLTLLALHFRTLRHPGVSPFSLLLFFAIYITLHPFNLLHATLLFLRGHRGW